MEKLYSFEILMGNLKTCIGTEQDGKLSDSVREIEIPDKVRNIGAQAFYRCDKIERVYIPDGVETISNWAFSRCTSLNNVVLPKTLRNIELGAFSYCQSLNRITIPASVRYIDNDAFVGTEDVVTVYTPEGSYAEWYAKRKGIKHEILTEEPTRVTLLADFEITDATLVKYHGTDAYPAVPCGVSVIADSAFAMNGYIKSVKLPEGVEKIENRAFLGCHSLEEVTIPATVKEIAPFAFADCTSLLEIDIPTSVEKIGISAFAQCKKLEKAVINSLDTKLGLSAFDGCDSVVVYAPQISHAWFYATEFGLDFEPLQVNNEDIDRSELFKKLIENISTAQPIDDGDEGLFEGDYYDPDYIFDLDGEDEFFVPDPDALEINIEDIDFNKILNDNN